MGFGIAFHFFGIPIPNQKIYIYIYIFFNYKRIISTVDCFGFNLCRRFVFRSDDNISLLYSSVHLFRSAAVSLRPSPTSSLTLSNSDQPPTHHHTILLSLTLQPSFPHFLRRYTSLISTSLDLRDQPRRQWSHGHRQHLHPHLRGRRLHSPPQELALFELHQAPQPRHQKPLLLFRASNQNCFASNSLLMLFRYGFSLVRMDKFVESLPMRIINPAIEEIMVLFSP
ncbi:hypothetical protein DVH24_010221 [Malus domestica]|uniref:Uncharacterized protein n=1 Tax=Malus domestica TaxID=3750 RepID=A0A498JS74_MALDO|nr:hypothetical protein DVH24_010221 [Malus domestica]